MKLNEEKSILYSLDPSKYKLYFDNVNNDSFFGICCYIREREQTPIFFEADKEDKNLILLDLSSKLTIKGGYDLYVFPFYKSTESQNPIEQRFREIDKNNLISIHIYYGECRLYMKKIGKEIYRILCDDKKIDLAKLKMRYSTASSPEPEDYKLCPIEKKYIEIPFFSETSDIRNVKICFDFEDKNKTDIYNDCLILNKRINQ